MHSAKLLVYVLYPKADHCPALHPCSMYTHLARDDFCDITPPRTRPRNHGPLDSLKTITLQTPSWMELHL
jgi:hypothetical protein